MPAQTIDSLDLALLRQVWLVWNLLPVKWPSPFINIESIRQIVLARGAKRWWQRRGFRNWASSNKLSSILSRKRIVAPTRASFLNLLHRESVIICLVCKIQVRKKQVWLKMQNLMAPVLLISIKLTKKAKISFKLAVWRSALPIPRVSWWMKLNCHLLVKP